MPNLLYYNRFLTKNNNFIAAILAFVLFYKFAHEKVVF